ncbi:hypothetical protein CH262_17510 [Rhodococcus sp. 05-2255-1e]|nr:hypothetical protein CH262_17510 [Rhodococcus sp. 05-2255-1e]
MTLRDCRLTLCEGQVSRAVRWLDPFCAHRSTDLAGRRIDRVRSLIVARNSDQAIRQVYGTPAVTVAQQALRNQAWQWIPDTSRYGLPDPPR